MRIDVCPRCGTKRPDAFQWCRKCGLDFAKAERGQLPADMRLTPTAGPPPPSDVQRVAPPVQQGPQWQQPAQPYIPQLDVRPVNDRKNMARLTANALDVRCGGTAGGCLGMIVGFLVFGYLGAAIGGVAPLLLIPIGVFVGLFVGMRVALGLMAR